jgi:hypothetical protein
MRWDDVLDAFEERLRAQEAAIAMQAPVPPDLPLEGGTDEMTPTAVLRATALLDRSRALEVQALAQLQKLRARQNR